MTIESVLPKTNNVLANSIPAMQTRPAVQPGVVGNVASFANTFRARALSSGCAELDSIFDAAGQKYNLSPDLLKAVAKVESTFRPHLVSKSGAMGIMQIMPGTARYLGVDDPFDPEQSIMGGARYLRENLDRFEGDIKLALAACNAGWPAVKKHGGIPPFRETQAYVPKVLGYFGSDEPSYNELTYSGFDMSGRISEPVASSNSNSAFNFNEALAQMLFIKLIEMQMGSNKENTGGVF